MSVIKPKNLTAQLSHRARGNPESTLSATAVSNCFPGLEFDFKNVWKNIFVEIELHETGSEGSGHLVLDVVPGTEASEKGVTVFSILLAVDDIDLTQVVNRPGSMDDIAPIELSNGLAGLMAKQGKRVRGRFEVRINEQVRQIDAELTVREIFDLSTISADLAEPGALSQGLCSPWQADYRECGCTYWAASRPDFVNADVDNEGNTTGHNWMQHTRTEGDTYRVDVGGHDSEGEFITYDDLYSRWEEVLRFVIQGKDKE